MGESDENNFIALFRRLISPGGIARGCRLDASTVDGLAEAARVAWRAVAAADDAGEADAEANVDRCVEAAERAYLERVGLVADATCCTHHLSLVVYERRARARAAAPPLARDALRKYVHLCVIRWFKPRLDAFRADEIRWPPRG